MLVSLKLVADFSRGCADRAITHLLFATHPYLPCSRGRSCASTLCPMILAAVNLYSLLQYLVLAISSKAGPLAIVRPHRGGPMQDGGYGLQRIHLPRTSVNKAFSDAAVFGRCHHAECERWLVHQKSRRKESSSYVLRRKQGDRAEPARST